MTLVRGNWGNLTRICNVLGLSYGFVLFCFFDESTLILKNCNDFDARRLGNPGESWHILRKHNEFDARRLRNPGESEGICRHVLKGNVSTWSPRAQSVQVMKLTRFLKEDISIWSPGASDEQMLNLIRFSYRTRIDLMIPQSSPASVNQSHCNSNGQIKISGKMLTQTLRENTQQLQISQDPPGSAKIPHAKCTNSDRNNNDSKIPQDPSWFS